MKDLAIIGRGKTGASVAKLAEAQGLSFTLFHTQNPPTLERLKEHHSIVLFIPAASFIELIPLLLESKKPLISGATGAELPVDLDEKLKESKATWIQGSNFSLGMNLIYQMIKTLSESPRLFPNQKIDVDIHEVHHTQKEDAPSGTAKKWSDWIKIPSSTTSAREGDVIGDHQLTLKTQREKITIRHQALDRSLFAEGALWAYDLLKQNNLSPGLYQFEDLARKELL